MVLLNGFDTDWISGLVKSAKENPQAIFEVKSKWTTRGKCTSHIAGHKMFGKSFNRDFDIHTDEPPELLGENTAPNPQDLLMAGLNTCMMIGYAVNAAAMGIKLDKLEITSKGELDLRGFLALDPTIKAGYETVEYTVYIQSNAPREKLEELHLHIQKTSPNFSNFATAIKLNPTLITESA